MSDWNDPRAKKAAAYEFCKRLDKDENDALRKECTEKMDTARRTLKEAGNFNNMPDGLQVYVYDPDETDERVVIILPEKGNLPDPFDIEKAWPCTWTPYRTLKNSKQKKEQ